MGPFHAPFRTGMAKIGKNSIFKTLVGVEAQQITVGTDKSVLEYIRPCI
jgi:hypothetical protein